jgi:hypothetical protein
MKLTSGLGQLNVVKGLGGPGEVIIWLLYTRFHEQKAVRDRIIIVFLMVKSRFAELKNF